MAKLTDKCSVYHIALPGWPESAGYIGIAADPEQRWKQHERDAHAKMSPLEVHHQMREHKGKYVKQVIFEGTRQECLDLEFELRSDWNMGWNTRPGGEWDERHWRPNPEWISHTLIHDTHGEVTTGPGLSLYDIAQKYQIGSRGKHGPYQGSTGGLSTVLKGNLTHFNGWRLADPVLAERVRQKCNRELGTCYITDGNQFAKFYANGAADFGRLVGLKSHRTNMGHVYRGLRKSTKGWELCTEEEYLANPGPVFGSPE